MKYKLRNISRKKNVIHCDIYFPEIGITLTSMSFYKESDISSWYMLYRNDDKISIDHDSRLKLCKDVAEKTEHLCPPDEL